MGLEAWDSCWIKWPDWSWLPASKENMVFISNCLHLTDLLKYLSLHCLKRAFKKPLYLMKRVFCKQCRLKIYYKICEVVAIPYENHILVWCSKSTTIRFTAIIRECYQIELWGINHQYKKGYHKYKYSRVCNRRRAGNKHRAWKIWQKE